MDDELNALTPTKNIIDEFLSVSTPRAHYRRKPKSSTSTSTNQLKSTIPTFKNVFQDTATRSKITNNVKSSLTLKNHNNRNNVNHKRTINDNNDETTNPNSTKKLKLNTNYVNNTPSNSVSSSKTMTPKKDFSTTANIASTDTSMHTSTSTISMDISFPQSSNDTLLMLHSSNKKHHDEYNTRKHETNNLSTISGCCTITQNNSTMTPQVSIPTLQSLYSTAKKRGSFVAQGIFSLNNYGSSSDNSFTYSFPTATITTNSNITNTISSNNQQYDLDWKLVQEYMTKLQQQQHSSQNVSSFKLSFLPLKQSQSQQDNWNDITPNSVSSSTLFTFPTLLLLLQSMNCALLLYQTQQQQQQPNFHFKNQNDSLKNDTESAHRLFYILIPTSPFEALLYPLSPLSSPVSFHNFSPQKDDNMNHVKDGRNISSSSNTIDSQVAIDSSKQVENTVDGSMDFCGPTSLYPEKIVTPSPPFHINTTTTTNCINTISAKTTNKAKSMCINTVQNFDHNAILLEPQQQQQQNKEFIPSWSHFLQQYNNSIRLNTPNPQRLIQELLPETIRSFSSSFFNDNDDSETPSHIIKLLRDSGDNSSSSSSFNGSNDESNSNHHPSNDFFLHTVLLTKDELSYLFSNRRLLKNGSLETERLTSSSYSKTKKKSHRKKDKNKEVRSLSQLENKNLKQCDKDTTTNSRSSRTTLDLLKDERLLQNDEYIFRLLYIQILLRLYIYRMFGWSKEIVVVDDVLMNGKNVMIWNEYFDMINQTCTKNMEESTLRQKETDNKHALTIQDFINDLCSTIQYISFVLSFDVSFSTFLNENIVSTYLIPSKWLRQKVKMFFEIEEEEEEIEEEDSRNKMSPIIHEAEENIQAAVLDKAALASATNRSQVANTISLVASLNESQEEDIMSSQNSRWDSIVIKDTTPDIPLDGDMISDDDLIEPNAKSDLIMDIKYLELSSTNLHRTSNPLLANSRGKYIGSHFTNSLSRKEVKLARSSNKTSTTTPHHKKSDTRGGTKALVLPRKGDCMNNTELSSSAAASPTGNKLVGRVHSDIKSTVMDTPIRKTGHQDNRDGFNCKSHWSPMSPGISPPKLLPRMLATEASFAMRRKK